MRKLLASALSCLGVFAAVAAARAHSSAASFGDALNLNGHFHSLVLDGVYVRSVEGVFASIRSRHPTTRTRSAWRACSSVAGSATTHRTTTPWQRMFVRLRNDVPEKPPDW